MKRKNKSNMKRKNKSNMKWYEFTQNNSGGNFLVNEKVCHRLFIEAEDIKHASQIAESLGVYFNGVNDGTDCECCGDRWYEPFQNIEFPLKYSESVIFKTVEEYAQYLANSYGWTTPDARIYYADKNVIDIHSIKSNKDEDE